MHSNDDNHQDKGKSTAKSSTRYPLGRRDAIKLLGAGVASSAFPEMARSANDPTVSPEVMPTQETSQNDVDVFVSVNPVRFNTSSPGGVGDVLVEVGNFGPNRTRRPVQVLVGTPFFADIDRSRLPQGVTVLFQDPRPHVPEIAQIIIPAGFAVGSTLTFRVPLVLANTPTPVPNKGWAVANVGASDAEANPGDNSTGYEVRMPVSSGASPGGNPVNLVSSFAKATLISGQTTNLPITISLQSGQLQGDPLFTFVLPYLTKINPTSQQPLPPNTTIVFNPSNAGAVPQILVIRLNRGQLNAQGSVTFNVPLMPTSVDGRPASRYGKSAVVPDPNSGDVDLDPTTAVGGVGTVQAA
jgi:hypothetical protein